jgi:hypothetical protein
MNTPQLAAGIKKSEASLFISNQSMFQNHRKQKSVLAIDR